ncbi:MAG: phage tail protein [Methylococcaceae bacterium]|nr:MAG: phage tail protein [Methylococcaceae bacterium]
MAIIKPFLLGGIPVPDLSLFNDVAPSVFTDAVLHARAELPRESCGLIVRIDGARRYWPCRNVSATPAAHFAIDPVDQVAAERVGTVEAIVHSHVLSAPEASEADRLSCNANGLPWLIVSADGRHGWLEPVPGAPVPPLVGRAFYYGLSDCLTLLRDYYALELGIALPDFDRGAPDWWRRGENRFVENIQAAGFVEATGRRQPHDVLLMQVLGSNVPNHCAIWIGDGRILHQVENRLSGYAVFGGALEKATARVCRHQSFIG